MIYYENSRSGAMISDPGGGWVMRADCEALAAENVRLAARVAELERERDAAIFRVSLLAGIPTELVLGGIREELSAITLAPSEPQP
jgi:hypothetical protein